MAQVLMSIRPEFVDRIFRRLKQVELRRGATRISPGDRLFIYCTSPVRQVVGVCTVGDVVVGSPAAIRRHIGRRAGVSRDEFDGYAAGAEILTALELEGIQRLAAPVGLGVLRRLQPKFVVPQSYRYLLPRETVVLARRSREARIAS